MSLFSYRVEISAQDQSRFETVEFLVDSASTYTWIPRGIVENLQLKVSGKKNQTR